MPASNVDNSPTNMGSSVIAKSQVNEPPFCVPQGHRAYHWLALTQNALAQVLLGPEMGSRTVHFDALRREVQLAARFNSERLVQARSSGSPYSHPPPSAPWR